MSEFIKPIDGLRAFAVLAVLARHWLGPDSIFHYLETGRIGLILLFVISGYLITGILLRLRDRIEVGTLDRPGALREFYIRRSLRIFPLYYHPTHIIHSASPCQGRCYPAPPLPPELIRTSL